jgi:uncharacterized membrane protein YfcA
MMQVKSTLIEHWRYCRTWASWYGGVPFAFMAAGLRSAGVSNLKLLETLRPLFIAVAVNCLVFAYRKLGQASIQVCKICSVCTDAQTLRTYRTLFWAIAALALASIGLTYVFYLLLGSAAGLLSGLFGIGGGIIIVPFLVWIFSAQGFAPESVMLMAVATSLATIIVTAAASLQSHHRLGAVDWPVVTRLVPGVLIGALLGSVVADSLPTDLFKTLFAFFPLGVAFQMIKPDSPTLDPEQPSDDRNLAGTGGIIGALCTLLGAGVGVITVPFLVKRRFPLHQAVAISSACGLPLAIVGSLGYIALGWGKTGLPSWSLGYLYVPAFLCIVTSSRVFAPLGAQLAHKLPTEKLKRFFALLLFAIGMRLLWQAVV